MSWHTSLGGPASVAVTEVASASKFMFSVCYNYGTEIRRSTIVEEVSHPCGFEWFEQRTTGGENGWEPRLSVYIGVPGFLPS
jgi:hypothetical protein